MQEGTVLSARHSMPAGSLEEGDPLKYPTSRVNMATKHIAQLGKQTDAGFVSAALLLKSGLTRLCEDQNLYVEDNCTRFFATLICKQQRKRKRSMCSPPAGSD